MTIMRQRGSVFPSVTHQDLPLRNSSSIIRKRFHPLGHLAGLHGEARSKVELVLLEALKLLDLKDAEIFNKLLTNDDVRTLMDFAKCIEPTSMFNCSAPGSYQYRTFDGTCNNMYNPLWGASNTAFRRLQAAQYEDGILTPVGYYQQVHGNPFAGPWPSARTVSAYIVKDVPKLSASVTHIFMIWGQFVDHDLDLFAVFDTDICESTCEFSDDTLPYCYPITVSPYDPAYGRRGPNRGKCLSLTRSVGTCMRPQNSSFNIARQQINQLTHYLDASNVYGSTKEVADSLRLFLGGRLRQGEKTDTPKGNLPFGTVLSQNGVPFFVAGDVRANENVALTVMHTIWLREHNRIVAELAEINPCWDDEKLYQEGRKIVGAMIQVITYREFLPLLLGQKGFNTFIASYSGYSYNTDPSIPNSFASAAYRFGHSLVRPSFGRLDVNNKPLPAGPLGLREAFFNPLQYFVSGGTDPLLRGLMQDQSRELDEFLTIVLTTQLFAPSDDKLGEDLASLNIQRAREHGIPSYQQFQKYCYDLYGIPSKFARSITERKLKHIYGKVGFANGIDLWLGGLAEEAMDGSILGPTLSCLIGKTFADLRNGDRFYWENPGVFTNQQRNSLGYISLSKVICNNADNIATIIPKAFATGQTAQDCSSLPAVNLNYWKDTSCKDSVLDLL